MSTIRAFIAIQLPADVRNELARVNEVLNAQLPANSVRWVKPHLMHLTLCFLGDTAMSSLPSLFDALDESAAMNNAFTLSLASLGCFPSRKRPRVIWAGLQGELNAAEGLKRTIDDLLLPLGWVREQRPFSPHLTLGRVRDSRKLQGVNWEAHVQKLTFPIEEVHLIESKLSPSGPIYTVRHTSQLPVQ